MSRYIYSYKSGVQKVKNRLGALKFAFASIAASAALLSGLIVPMTATHARQGVATGGGGGGATSGSVDLQISGSASTNSPDPGAAYTYKFNVKNSGNATATNVVFTAPTPSNTIPNFATLQDSTLPCSNVGNNDQGGSSVQCSVASLAKGDQVSIVVGVTAPQVAQSVTESASVISTETDSNAANNAVTVNVTIKAPTGGLCKGGVCDTVGSIQATPCAALTSATAPVGYYSIWAAIWNTFTVQSCSTNTQTVNVQVTERNIATGSIDYDITMPITLVSGQNYSMVLDNDFAAYSTSYDISFTVSDPSSGTVLSTATTQATTPPQR